MEKPQFSHNTPPRIAIIVLYFGKLPPYFPIWLKSAEANPDVDFLVWSDQDIPTDAPNFHVHKVTLDELMGRFSRTLRRSLQVLSPHKLCDYRPAFGLLFEEELRGYDFWGHCDVDLVFGHIRHFLTDELLETYDRFYAYGHLNLYRNNEKMRHAFELPGSWFTLDEMFGPIHIGFDEYDGINHICLKNRIPWYTNIDFAHLNSDLKTRLEIDHQQPNYPTQIFYWLDGRAFQRYVDGEQIHERELVYIHWISKRPITERIPMRGEAVVITPEKLLVCSPEDLTPENMLRWNPSFIKQDNVREKWKRRKKRYLEFLTGSLAFKKIWLKRKAFLLLERKIKKLPYL